MKRKKNRRKLEVSFCVSLNVDDRRVFTLGREVKILCETIDVPIEKRFQVRQEEAYIENKVSRMLGACRYDV